MNATMVITSRLEKIFPEEKHIPSQYSFSHPIEQREYLVDGEILKWNGPVQDIYSPVFTYEGDKYIQKRLGAQPVLDSSAVLNALDAAVKSYDNGRGEWATMSVKKRIEHLMLFARMMKEKREEVVK